MTLTSRAVLRARPGCREEVEGTARSLAASAAEEAGTLRYDWFTSTDDADLFVAIEVYTDAAAAMAHNEHCQELLERMFTLADMVAVELHGDLDARLEQWVAGHPAAHAFAPLR